jgi:predicted metal-dependent phosphoesterase TrpH
MKIDLHTHSRASDGSLTPRELIEEAIRQGVDVLGLTDHDTMSGLAEARQAAKERRLTFIPGIEFSTEAGHAELHILGYFVQENHPALSTLLGKLKTSRHERIFRIIGKLATVGVHLQPEDVIEEAKDGVYGRPQVALALVRHGYVQTIEEAFERYLGNRRPAYVSHFKLTPWQVIEKVLEAGGIPVLAHPAISSRDDLIPSLVKSGLAGLEVYYLEHDSAMVARYLQIAKKWELIVTGGSDFHGNTGKAPLLGAPRLTEADIRILLEKVRETESKAMPAVIAGKLTDP